MKDRYLKPKDLAEYLGISESTARAIMPDIPGCIDVGGGGRNRALRVPVSGIEAWQSNKVVNIARSSGKIARRPVGRRKTG